MQAIMQQRLWFFWFFFICLVTSCPNFHISYFSKNMALKNFDFYIKQYMQFSVENDKNITHSPLGPLDFWILLVWFIL